MAWYAGLAVLGSAALAVVLGVTAADADLWGHVRFGLDILAAGAAPDVDPYSYATVGQRFIDHEWLGDALFGLAWRAGGAPGLIALKGAVGFATIVALFRELRRHGLHPVQAAILLMLLGAPLSSSFVSVRPQIFTYALFALLLILIRRAEDGAYRVLWLAPPMMALWANLHGGVLAGVGILGLWTLLHLRSHFAERWRFVPPAALAACATLLTPYGPDLLFFLLQTATVPRPEIQDWQPLGLASLLGAEYLVIVAGAATGIALSTERRNATLLALCAVCVLLPWLAVRHLTLCSIAVLVFAGEHVASAWRAHVGAAGAPADEPVAPWAAALPVAAAALMLGIAAREQVFTRITIASNDYWPRAGTALLARAGQPANVITEFGWGEYLLWHLGPRIQVGIDGRREALYPRDYYERYLDFIYGKREWDAVLKRFPTDAALVPKERAAYNLLKLSTGWALVYEDAKSGLFVNRASALFAPLSAAARGFTPPPADLAFPG